MAHSDDVVATLDNLSGSVCDDCLTNVLNLKRRQIADRVCTDLAGQGAIDRSAGICSMCGKSKLVNRSLHSVQAARKTQAPIQRQHTQRPWFWEGNVQAAVVTYLARNGHQIRSVADTAARSHGIDIVATASGAKDLLITVKGYPQARPDKVTQPSTQAVHWFAAAILDIVFYRQQHPQALLAIGLPDGFERYAGLVAKAEWFRKAAPFSIFWVGESGEVRVE